MSLINLLTDYQLVVRDVKAFKFAPPNPGVAEIEYAQTRIFLWLTFAKPETDGKDIDTKPIPVLIDTSFNNTLLISEQQLTQWVGLPLSQDWSIGVRATFGRADGSVVADGYCLDFWAAPQVAGPSGFAPDVQLVRIASGLEVWVYRAKERDLSRPPLLGLKALNAIGAKMEVDFLINKASLTVNI